MEIYVYQTVDNRRNWEKCWGFYFSGGDKLH